VGVGSGLSAAGGLNYADPALLKRWFSEYADQGFKTLLEVQGMFWWLSQSKPENYWGYWARHIYHIRYETGVLKPYQDLFNLLKSKDYFICSTNADGQIKKAGFSKDRVFAPQGDYEFFQCSKHCSEDIYQNRIMVETMIKNMPSATEICSDDIPVCPRCGAGLVPNLRCDDTFVQTPHMKILPAFEKFIQDSAGKNTVLIELGVGYNTPGVIRYPFEKITQKQTEARLIRVNKAYADVPKEIEDKSISIQADLARALSDIATICSNGIQEDTTAQ